MTLGTVEIVLGITWLASLETIKVNWKELFLKFNYKGRQWRFLGLKIRKKVHPRPLFNPKFFHMLSIFYHYYSSLEFSLHFSRTFFFTPTQNSYAFHSTNLKFYTPKFKALSLFLSWKKWNWETKIWVVRNGVYLFCPSTSPFVCPNMIHGGCV